MILGWSGGVLLAVGLAHGEAAVPARTIAAVPPPARVAADPTVPVAQPAADRGGFLAFPSTDRLGRIVNGRRLVEGVR